MEKESRNNKRRKWLESRMYKTDLGGGGVAVTGDDNLE